MKDNKEKYKKIIDKFSLKQLKMYRNIFIVLGIATCLLVYTIPIGIICFSLAYTYNKCITFKKDGFDNKKDSHNIKKEHTHNLIKEVYFKVAGVTFENRQKIIKKIVKNAIKLEYTETYYNMTNKEIIDSMDEIYEINDLKVSSLRLEPTEIDNKDAIEVFIKDFDKEQEYLMGYVPKNKLNEVIDFLQIVQEHSEYIIKADAYFTGGKFKKSKYDEEKEKDVIITDERKYGINVNLKLYDK